MCLAQRCRNVTSPSRNPAHLPKPPCSLQFMIRKGTSEVFTSIAAAVRVPEHVKVRVPIAPSQLYLALVERKHHCKTQRPLSPPGTRLDPVRGPEVSQRGLRKVRRAVRLQDKQVGDASAHRLTDLESLLRTQATVAPAMSTYPELHAGSLNVWKRSKV